jgi:hypothetical protein
MTTTDPTLSPNPAPFVPTAASAVAFEQTKAEIHEAAKGPLDPVNVDIAFAVRVMLTVCGNAAPYRTELAKVNLDVVPMLETRAHALSYAQALHQWTLDTPSPVEALGQEVIEARRVLASELELVQLRGIIANTAVKLQGTTSYLAMAQDVRTIGSAFLSAWERVGPQIGGNIEHVNNALVLADKLIGAVAQAAEIKEKLKGSALVRQAAWTLALKSYRDLDRGISFLRYHEGDADQIVPSLFDKAKPRKKLVPEADSSATSASSAQSAAEANEGTGQVTPLVSPLAPSKPFDE